MNMTRTKLWVAINMVLWVMTLTMLIDGSTVAIDRILTVIFASGAALGLHFIVQYMTGKE